MSKKASSNPRKVREIDDGAAFVQLPLELLVSPAWCGQSINCRRLVDFLMAEHARHAGLENGHLLALYDQLEGAGIGRRFIQKTIAESEQRGLVQASRGARASRTSFYATHFRLTFFKTVRKDEAGTAYWIVPTHEWRQFTQNNGSKNRIRSYEGEPPECTFVQSQSAPFDSSKDTGPAEMLDSAASVELSKGALLYISWLPSGDLQTPNVAWPGMEASPPQRSSAPPIQGGRGDATEEGGLHSMADVLSAIMPVPAAPVPDNPPTITTDHSSSIIEMAGRQHLRQQPEPHVDIIQDPRQVDLVEFITGQNSAAISPVDRLRADLKARLKDAPKGEQSRVAVLVNLSRSQISNFLAGGWGLNAGAASILRRYLDGEIAA